MTLRRALENSRNLATANLLLGGIDMTPALSLDRICALAMEAQIYRDCSRYYPFVLGAQPVRPIDLAAFFAAIANEGVRPSPHVIESIEQDGKVIYRHPAESAARIGSADGVAFYQLKAILQGVLQRGTATRIAGLAPYVAGKTGTTDGENDAWFVGFTNEVTVAVWVGYDNADGRRRTLGSGATGGSLAVPIFEPIIQAVWAHHAPRTTLRGPSPETRKLVVATRVDADHDDGTRDFTGAGGGRRHPRNAGRISAPRRQRAADRHPVPAGVARRSVRRRRPARRPRLRRIRFLLRRRPRRLRALGAVAFAAGVRAECAAAAAAAVPTTALAGGPELMGSAWARSRRPAGGAGGFFCGGGRAGIRDRRDAVRHPAAGRAAQAAVDRLFRQARRRSGRSGGRVHPLRGLGQGAPGPAAVPEPLSRLHRAERRHHRRRHHAAAIASGCTCMWRRRASSFRGRRHRSKLARPRDPAVRRADRSRHQAPAGDRGRPGPPAATPGSSTTSIRSGNGARAGRS